MTKSRVLLLRQLTLYSTSYPFLALSHTGWPARVIEKLLTTQQNAARASHVLVRSNLVGVDEVVECVLAGWHGRPAGISMSEDAVGAVNALVAVDADRDRCRENGLLLAVVATHRCSIVTVEDMRCCMGGPRASWVI